MEQTLFAPAKLNLSLRVTGKREDGYHTLNSLIAFTNLCDALFIKDADSYALHVTGDFAAGAPAGDNNLVTRAVRLMEEACGRKADIDVTLTKSIPVGAGLGGGSADAAAILRALNARWAGPLSEDYLRHISLELGAELPVCLAGGAQWVGGIGENVMPIHIPRMHAIVIWPGVDLATSDVFNAYKGPYSQPFEAGGSLVSENDLTKAAVSLAPVIGQALKVLPNSCMTGSGSAVFSVCDDGNVAKKTAALLAAEYPKWWIRDVLINP